ncbi:Uncharacterised protein [Ewingella americana]|uniref:Uncharacterized protein n=1 Tax=Ewingella americana TaxID=41202 RepID=A0A377NH30_9GAMM|nr:Uncharacterised protein [Ewingella americana]
MPDWIDDAQEWQAKVLDAQIAQAKTPSRLPSAFSVRIAPKRYLSRDGD